MRQRVADTLQAAAAQLPDTGLVEDLVRLLWEDPHQAELDLRDAVAGLARGLWGPAFAARDDHGDRVQIDGKSTRQVAASPGQATTLFGTVTFPRARTRPSGAGASVVPTEPIRGLTPGGMTPAAAGLSAAIMARLPARDGADLWQRICGAGPATRSLIRLTAEGGQEFEDQADDLLAEVRGDEDWHDDAVALRVSRDGTMLRMHEDAWNGQVMEPGGREVACGVVAQRGSEGTMLTQRTFARLPEPGQTCLKRQISQEVWHGMPQAAAQGRALKIVAIADGARDNGTFLDSLSPDIRLIDVGQACPSLKAAAAAAEGAESARSTAGFDTYKDILTEDPHDVGGRGPGD